MGGETGEGNEPPKYPLQNRGRAADTVGATPEITTYRAGALERTECRQAEQAGPRENRGQAGRPYTLFLTNVEPRLRLGGKGGG